MFAAAAITAAAASALPGAAASQAMFTEEQQVTDNTFAAAQVQISTPAQAVLNVSDLVPGERVVAALEVTNSGSQTLRYAMSAHSDSADADTLAGQLRLEVKAEVAQCTASGYRKSGTKLYGPGPVGTTSGQVIFGDPAQGQDPGDRVLAAGATETLCLSVWLPPDTDSSMRDRSTTVTFELRAEQTKHNP